MQARDKKQSEQKEFSQKTVEKQRLKDLEHMISVDLGTFLVLIEEGTPQQAALARQKTKSTLLKYGPDMSKIAAQMGDPYPSYVEDFLHSIDDIVHSSGWVDEAQIKQCFRATQKLEQAL